MATPLGAALAAERSKGLKVDQILASLSSDDKQLLLEALTELNDVTGAYAVSAEGISRSLSKTGHPCSGDAVNKWRNRQTQGDA